MLAQISIHHHEHVQSLRWQGLPLPRRTPEDARKELEDEYLTYRLEGEAADVAKCGVDSKNSTRLSVCWQPLLFEGRY